MHQTHLIPSAVTVVVLGLVLYFAPVPGAGVVPIPDAKDTSWPMFGGTPSRDMVNADAKNLPAEWSGATGNEKNVLSTNVLWSVDLGSIAYGGPIIADGKVFVSTNNDRPRNPKIKGDKGVVMCFSAAHGQFLWQAVHDKLDHARGSDMPREGIVSSPIVEGKRLYYVNNRCELVCADTEGFRDGNNDGIQDEAATSAIDADIIWRLDMIKDLKVFPHNLAVCSPLIVGDLVFVVTGNGVDQGHLNVPFPKAPSFIAVNKHTGKVVWQDNSPGTNIMHAQWSNPTYAVVRGVRQVIFPGGDGWLRGFDPESGKLLWKFDGNPKNSKYRLGAKGTKNDYLATPVVYENKLYIGVGQDPEYDEGIGHFWCVDLVKAIEKGKTNNDHDVSPVNDNFDPSAAVNKNSALAWHFGGPAQNDRNYLFGRTLSTAAVHDGLVYAAELAGILHCLDARTGKQNWEHEMGSQTWCSPYWVDGRIFLGNNAGEVFVFAHGKEKKEPKIVDTGARCVRVTPIVANGVLYLLTGTPTRLYAIGKK